MRREQRDGGAEKKGRAAVLSRREAGGEWMGKREGKRLFG